jgi:hypothetical protein
MKRARRISAAATALVGATLLSAGCSGSAPRSEEGATSDSAQAVGAKSTRRGREAKKGELRDGYDDEPGTEAGPHEPPHKPLVAPTASDPYRKVPSGSEGPKSKAPARFVAPTKEPRPGHRKLRLPARLAVVFVAQGRCARQVKPLLELESLLAKDPALSAVVSLGLPRGPNVNLLGLGRLARKAGHDLLLVILRSSDPRHSRRAYLLHVQDRAREPLVLARLEAAPRKGPPATNHDPAVGAHASLALELEVVVHSVAQAHSRMRR